MKISFVWQGVTERFDHWNDGLREAMRLIEKEHEVVYNEPWDDIQADVAFYWEAPCTINGANAHHYNRVRSLPIRKHLLFAGGPVQWEWVKGFDHVYVESRINKEEFDRLGVANSTAFGVNTEIFKPLKVEKIYKTVTHGTCASWKRQWLVCQAFGKRALVFGQLQETDPRPFDECRKCDAVVLAEQSYEETNKLLNSAEFAVNCADFWGGGQRATLEALACNLDVVVMDDSPKNREYIEESGCGVISSPEPEAIKRAIYSLDEKQRNHRKGREYVLSKWTPAHYKNALLNAL